MSTWLQRLVAILLISLGLSAVQAPFRTHTIREERRETIHARFAGFSAEGDALRSAWKIGRAGDNADRFSAILRSLDRIADDPSSRGGRMGLLRASSREAAAFLPPSGEGEAEADFRLIYRDELFMVRNPAGKLARIAADSGAGMSPELEMTLTVEWLGSVVPAGDALDLPEERLSEYPEVTAFLERETLPSIQGKESFPRWQDWASLVREAGGNAAVDTETRIDFRGRLLDVAADEVGVKIPEEVPRLKTLLKVGGAVLFVVALLLLIRVHARKGPPGAIRVGSTWTLVAGELIVIVLAGLAWTAVVDLLLNRILGVPLLVGESFLPAMGAFVLVIAVPLVTLYLSCLGAQWLAVGSDGIRLRSLGGDHFVTWNDVEAIECRRSFLFPVFRLGLPLPRTLQKSLVFEGASDRVSIMEPGEGRKKEIRALLAGHVPEQWSAALERAEAEWKGYEPW